MTDESDMTDDEFDKAMAEGEPVLVVGRHARHALTFATGDTFTITCTCGILAGGTLDVQPSCDMHGQERWQRP